MKKELLTYKDPKSPVSEIFRTLRTNIEYLSIKNNLKTLMVTSTTYGEGKTWISANLAISFAQSGKKVIIVDADLRKGRQFDLFGIRPEPGISNLLSKIDENNLISTDIKFTDYIQKTDIKNLEVLVAGNMSQIPSELLISEKISLLLEQLKLRYDLIIVDSTPCDFVADAITFSRLVDATLVVTAQKETKKENLVKTVKSIKNAGGNICGVVVNKMTISDKKYSKSYYYGETSLKVFSNYDNTLRTLKMKFLNFIQKQKNKKIQRENKKMYEKLAEQENQKKMEEEQIKLLEEQEKILAEQKRLEEERLVLEEKAREQEELKEQAKTVDYKNNINKEIEKQKLYEEQMAFEQFKTKNKNIIDKNNENVVKNDIDDFDNSNLENQITLEQQEKANRIMKQVDEYVQLEMQKQERK